MFSSAWSLNYSRLLTQLECACKILTITRTVLPHKTASTETFKLWSNISMDSHYRRPLLGVSLFILRTYESSPVHCCTLPIILMSNAEVNHILTLLIAEWHQQAFIDLRLKWCTTCDPFHKYVHNQQPSSLDPQGRPVPICSSGMQNHSDLCGLAIVDDVPSSYVRSSQNIGDLYHHHPATRTTSFWKEFPCWYFVNCTGYAEFTYLFVAFHPLG